MRGSLKISTIVFINLGGKKYRLKMEKSEIEAVRYSLLRILCNAIGTYRKTIEPDKKDGYKSNLKKIIGKLIDKIDNNAITNTDIRNSITELKENCGISIGASQKAINVYLKYYCIVANKENEILKELDCPIDSSIITFLRKHNEFKKISLKNLDDLKEYEKIQNKLEKEYTMKILADIELYDKKKAY